MIQYAHESVLLVESLALLKVKPDGVYVDATVGGGGHTAGIAGSLSSAGHVYGFDKDLASLSAAKIRLDAFGARVTLIRSDFRNMQGELEKYAVAAVDGVLFDLGVSSPQLDDPERGFSYRADAPLDMRMDRSQALTAREIVNGWPEAELFRIFRDYGEERYAARVAAAVVRCRRDYPVETTGQLVNIIRRVMPGNALRESQHPARRVFQALRIAVGDELGAVEEGLRAAIGLLKRGGIVVVIGFHSLEDRIVKRIMAEGARGCVCPPGFPVCVCGRKPTLRLLSRKVVKASQSELSANPRAHSARLRAAERL